MFKLLNTTANNISITYLVFINLIPLFGVLFWGWNLFTIMFMYWIESIIIGSYNILKIMKAKKREENSGSVSFTINGMSANKAPKRYFVMFFLVQYGFLVFAYGAILFFFFIFYAKTPIEYPEMLVLIFAALFVNHGISYIYFLKNEEYMNVSPHTQMLIPFDRIFILALSLFLGAYASSKFNFPTASLIVLVVYKTVYDLWCHKKDRSAAVMRENGKK